MPPSISVVIPLYNKAPHIGQTLNSVLAQQTLPLEIIVVDDGSTDNGGRVVENIEHPLIRLLRQDNQGESAARNLGVIEAKGQYIAFLDADDFWHDNHLSTLAELISIHPDAGLFSTMHEIHQHGQTISPRFAFPAGFKGLVKDYFKSFADGLSLINSTTACVRRDALLSIGGFPVGVKKGPDLITWTKLARNFAMAHAAITTAVYNRDAVNRSVQLRETEAPGSLLYLAELLNENIEQEERASVLLLFSRIAFYTCAGMSEEGNYGAVLAIRRLVKQSGLWILYAKITVLLAIPPFLLTYARRFRHRL